MPKKKSKQARRAEKWKKQSPQGISWKTVAAILISIATFVGLIVNGLDFINYLREGYQQFLWFGIVVLGLIWLIILWLLFKQKNIYGILWLTVTVLAGVVVWTGWQSYIQTRAEKLIVLIAQFDGPEEVYGLRNEIWENLSDDFNNDANVKIETINEIITPDSESGSPHAIEIGIRQQADIVIWGWYRPTENPNMTIHIENLATDGSIFLEESTTLMPITTLAELQASTFQMVAGQETSALISFLAGVIEYKSGNFDEAIVLFNKSIEKIGTETRLLDNLDQIHFYKADANYLMGRIDDAISGYSDAIEIYPQHEAAYINRGNAYDTLGEHDLAIQDYDKAIEINPKSFMAFVNRGIVYDILGQQERAIRDYSTAIEINSHDIIAYFNRATAYFHLSQYERGIQDLNKVIEINPQEFVAYNQRGIAYANLEQFQLAIQDFDKAIEINPESANTYFNRGNAYVFLEQ